MTIQVRELVDSLVQDRDFREASIAAPDAAARAALAADRGVAVPTLGDFEAAVHGLPSQGSAPDTTMAAGFWLSAFWMSNEN